MEDTLAETLKRVESMVDSLKADVKVLKEER
jgi:hypothetical protein